ncbi:succinate dehydrogenase, hydrophobic membrane anchor protein [Cohaesibacter celericrescens]|jgi:succinate dehydrogenase / fumarate reductase membrane anchor subunit|uniref:Succinate dehydrogenase hydrophobic membrane anchor subunit n=1 Tax=Cohaesibacter celericrescens TaxID=2067669 RepID=A0A2N5XPM9_9HYPH|nr:succinate dehydrogenase, hydrophobic membrane anchor protein [Cohaesibacter celericrescens]PLW76387.1 succinate dehydrogenase, hydrophobic membrane anchor protein [Cohaesibacter celericrescens]
MKTPLKTIRGLGNTHHGTEHHWIMRLTSVALLFLSVGFIWFVISALNSDYESAKVLVGHPVVAVMLLLFVVIGCYHMYQGSLTITEDYFQCQLYRTASKIATFFLSTVVGTACVFAVLKVSFGG